MSPLLVLALICVYGWLGWHWLPFMLFLAGAFVLLYLLGESIFAGSAPHMSTRRKLMMASWGSPSEAQVFGVITVNAEHLMMYLDKLAAAGTKSSVTTAVIKAVGLAMKESPGLNSHIAFGRFVPRKSMDVACLVALDDGSDLAVAKLSSVDTKTLADLGSEIKAKAEKLRAHKDADFEASKPLLSLLPVCVLEPIVATVGYLAGALGCNIPALGVRPFPFGSAMVTSVGMLGVEQAYVPFTPFARVPFLLMVGEVAPKAVVNSAGQIVAQRTLVLTGTLDHRFADGSEAARLSKRLKQVLENPAMLEDVTPMKTPEEIAAAKKANREAKKKH